MNKKLVIIAVTALVVVVGAVAVIALNGNNSSQPTATNDTSSMSNMPTNGSSSSSSSAVAATSVTIQNYAFSPASIKVKVGDTVTWTNQDSVSHTITADNASSTAPNSQLIAKGETYKFTFTKAGTYAYHCTPHPYMKGTVTVTE